MGPVMIGILAFLAIFGGALLGARVGSLLPRHHLATETRDAVSAILAIVSTSSALVIGLLLSDANAAFAVRSDAASGMAANILRLDRSLRLYGDEAAAAQTQLRAYATVKAAEMTAEAAPPMVSPALEILERLTTTVVDLQPQNEEQKFLRQQALSLSQSITDDRWTIVRQSGESSPTPMIVMLTVWLSLVFVGIGVFAPRNATVFTAVTCSALAAAAGIYMIVELGSPTRGVLRTPTAAITNAARIMAR